MAVDARTIRTGLDDIKRQLKKLREIRDAATYRRIQKDQTNPRSKGKGDEAAQTAKAPKAGKAILVR